MPVAGACCTIKEFDIESCHAVLWYSRSSQVSHSVKERFSEKLSNVGLVLQEFLSVHNATPFLYILPYANPDHHHLVILKVTV